MKTIERIFRAAQAEYDFSSFTKEDYHRICKAENITPVEIELSGDGYYVRSKKGNLYIYINSKLSNKEFLKTAAHELGHHFCGHKRLLHLDDDSEPRKQAEKEADHFAELILNAVLGAEFITDVLEAEYLEVS